MRDIILLLAGFFGLGGALGFVLSHSSPVQLGTIDVHALIAQRAESLAKTNGKDVQPQQIKHLSEKMKTDLAQLSQEKKVVLFSKGAVLAGDLPDYTSALLEKNQKGDNS